MPLRSPANSKPCSDELYRYLAALSIRQGRFKDIEWLEMGITEVERFGGCLPEAYSPLGRTMFQHIYIAGRVLPGNLWKIQSQGLPSFLYASKHCLSRSNHGIFFLVLESFCSSSLEQPSSSLLGLEPLSLKPLSSSLLAGSLPRCVTVPVLMALPCWSMVEDGSSRIGSASTAVDRIIPLDES